jgi:hypothetical protein
MHAMKESKKKRKKDGMNERLLALMNDREVTQIKLRPTHSATRPGRVSSQQADDVL